MTVPTTAVREGSRWRYVKPDSTEVGEWFKTVPLDEGMAHEDFVAGVVIIPANEKVKYQTERGTADRYEMTFTPYVRVDTRIAYFHKLAAANEQVAVIEPVVVPKVQSGVGKNDHMPEGYWWYIVGTEQQNTRFLCCTMRVALYKADEYFSHPGDTKGGSPPLRPVRFGVSTKQIAGPADLNALAKAETGAIGRALGVAGILVVGTGIATAEDMAEVRGGDAPVELPETVQEQITPEQVNSRLISLSTDLKADAPARWEEFSAWWKERQSEEGWRTTNDAPIEVRRGMVRKMEAMLAEGDANTAAPQEPASPDLSPANEGS